MDEHGQALLNLTPTQFEDFCRRFLWRWGFFNLEKLAGPGDKGRDLVGETIDHPLPGRQFVRTWVIQCKRWKKCPSKTRLKEGFDAALEHHPDHYLLLGTFVPTHGMLDWVAEVRSMFPFRILVVGVDEIQQWARWAPEIGYELLLGKPASGPYTTLLREFFEAIGESVVAGPEALTTYSISMGLCCSLRHPAMTSIHLLAAINSKSDTLASSLLREADLRTSQIQRMLSTKKRTRFHPTVSLSQNARSAVRRAASIADNGGPHRRVDDLDLLTALLQSRESGATKLLRVLGVDLETLAARGAALQGQRAELTTSSNLYRTLGLSIETI